jgi:hypothetical protein
MSAEKSMTSTVGRPFAKGQSGNPGGRPKGLAEAVKAKVGKDGKKLVEGLYLIAFGKPDEIAAFFGQVVEPEVRDRRECIKELLDRGFGRSVQALEHSGPDGAPIPVGRVVRVIVADPRSGGDA